MTNRTRGKSGSNENSAKEILYDDDFLEKMSDLIAKKLTISIDKKIEELNKKVNLLEEENKILKNKVIALEQYGRRNSIRIFGVPEDKNEDPVKTIKNLLQSKLNIQINNNDIDAVHRLGKKNKNSNRSIICKFTSRLMRDEIFFNKRKLKGSKIIIREDLSKERLQLYKYVTNKIQTQNVWTRRGDVYVAHQKSKFKFTNIEEFDDFYEKNFNDGLNVSMVSSRST